MADYDWFSMDCGCYYRHHESCKQHPLHEHYQKRSQGFIYIEEIDAYECRRGCGTVVWDIPTHIKNVCPKFEPVVGSES